MRRIYTLIICATLLIQVPAYGFWDLGWMFGESDEASSEQDQCVHQNSGFFSKFLDSFFGFGAQSLRLCVEQTKVGSSSDENKGYSLDDTCNCFQNGSIEDSLPAEKLQIALESFAKLRKETQEEQLVGEYYKARNELMVALFYMKNADIPYPLKCQKVEEKFNEICHGDDKAQRNRNTLLDDVLTRYLNYSEKISSTGNPDARDTRRFKMLKEAMGDTDPNTFFNDPTAFNPMEVVDLNSTDEQRRAVFSMAIAEMEVALREVGKDVFEGTNISISDGEDIPTKLLSEINNTEKVNQDSEIAKGQKLKDNIGAYLYDRINKTLTEQVGHENRDATIFALTIFKIPGGGVYNRMFDHLGTLGSINDFNKDDLFQTYLNDFEHSRSVLTDQSSQSYKGQEDLCVSFLESSQKICSGNPIDVSDSGDNVMLGLKDLEEHLKAEIEDDFDYAALLCHAINEVKTGSESFKVAFDRNTELVLGSGTDVTRAPPEDSVRSTGHRSSGGGGLLDTLLTSVSGGGSGGSRSGPGSLVADVPNTIMSNLDNRIRQNATNPRALSSSLDGLNGTVKPVSSSEVASANKTWGDVISNAREGFRTGDSSGGIANQGAFRVPASVSTDAKGTKTDDSRENKTDSVGVSPEKDELLNEIKSIRKNNEDLLAEIEKQRRELQEANSAQERKNLEDSIKRLEDRLAISEKRAIEAERALKSLDGENVTDRPATRTEYQRPYPTPSSYSSTKDADSKNNPASATPAPATSRLGTPTGSSSPVVTGGRSGEGSSGTGGGGITLESGRMMSETEFKALSVSQLKEYKVGDLIYVTASGGAVQRYKVVDVGGVNIAVLVDAEGKEIVEKGARIPASEGDESGERISSQADLRINDAENVKRPLHETVIQMFRDALFSN